MNGAKYRSVNAICVHQWLAGWNKIDFDEESYRRKPEERFYIFSLPARELKSLTGIIRREAKETKPRNDELGIQRQHDPERSGEISRFVEFGYPWSTLSKPKRLSKEFQDLRKPGWLPTAIVINILRPEDRRRGVAVSSADLVKVVQRNDSAEIHLPYHHWSKEWRPKSLPPFEVIDGQHRLWAFQEGPELPTFELPVVAFYGLDISWQAYLFWTINIKPKRINASLAFDLYPLLRDEDWLEKVDTHTVYRETRAQELTEILWSSSDSPWHHRINMLGERNNPWVSQSAWIKSLTATFVRSWDGRGESVGGLFGGRSKRGGEVLGWNRAQQGAFLVALWKYFAAAVRASSNEWARDLRNIKGGGQATLDLDRSIDFAFYGPYSLINTDQGVRGILKIFNDFFYVRASKLRLSDWVPSEMSSEDIVQEVLGAMKSLEKQSFVPFLIRLAKHIADFDWRLSSTPHLEESERRAKLVFRGSSGYKEIRRQLIEHLLLAGDDVADAARIVQG